MARLATKPDSSFFEKIVRGAIGARAVRDFLGHAGHCLIELERGSMDTKLWKDVKRKRVRIPDLVCTRCGQRVESRAKADARLAMSHSDKDSERAWDFGMIDSDWVAFPVCKTPEKLFWGVGKLRGDASYWHERNWSRWQFVGRINLVTVGEFRKVPFKHVPKKGVTEGSESIIVWPATFATAAATVTGIRPGKVTVKRPSARNANTRTIPLDQTVQVLAGQAVEENQILASTVPPLAAITCPGRLPDKHLTTLLASRERTQRFTGVKLARFLKDESVKGLVTELYKDAEEDVYIRLEAASYLASVGAEPLGGLFRPFLEHADDQTKLEAVIALGETDSPDAVGMLSEILAPPARPYFMKSAAVWGLGQIRSEPATRKLVELFTDTQQQLRQEALDRVVLIGRETTPILIERLLGDDSAIAAGCAEALRQLRPEAPELIAKVNKTLTGQTPPPWPVWLIGNLPKAEFAPEVAKLQDVEPEVHYTINLLWAFTESWISQRWERDPNPDSRSIGEANAV